MLIHPWDVPLDEAEWWEFARAARLAHLVAPGSGRELPIVVPTQYLLLGAPAAPEVVLHLARPNPVFAAIEESSKVILSIAGDWAFIPASWKAVGEEDPSRGIPTTYYGAVQLIGEAEIADEREAKLAILRSQLAVFQPDDGHVDPSEHEKSLPAIRGIRISRIEVRAKFKYGGNVDEEHRRAVAARLYERGSASDVAASSHVLRRIGGGLGSSGL
ncbi:MAG: FMN-binding negative transcriptional regulator [Terriglobales bacterium]